MKNPPKFNEEDINKINKMDLAAYFDDFMRRRPQSSGGYISLAKENFRKMVEKSKHEADLKTLVYAYINFLGHRNLVPQTYLDQMLLKALELQHPEVMFEIIQNHSELIYHPSANVLKQYIEFLEPKYDQLKLFFEATKGNYFLLLPKNFQSMIIDKAFENKDKKTVIAAYLEVLNYENIDKEQLIKVFESLEYEDAIDHGLIHQISQLIEKRGWTSDSNVRLQ